MRIPITFGAAFRVYSVLLILIGTVGAADNSNAESVENRLEGFIIYFEDGEYTKAADSLEVLLPDIDDPVLEARAYKYLAFSNVMLDRINEAKVLFAVALEKHPDLAVDTLAVPPNVTIVFRQAKLEKEMKLEKARNSPEIRRMRLLGAGTLSGGLLSLAAGTYFMYDSYSQYQKYMGVESSDPNALKVMDEYYDSHRRSYIAGGIFGGVGIIMVPVSIYLFSRSNKLIAVLPGIRGLSVAVRF